MSEPNGYKRNPYRNKEGLTPQQAAFKEKALQVGPEQAAREAYPDATPKSQEEISRENLLKPVVINSISKEMQSMGLGRRVFLETIKDGLQATKLFGKEAIEHEDHGSRLKAAEIGLKLHGELRNESSPGGVTMTKEAFVEMCKEFWGSKPGPIQP